MIQHRRLLLIAYDSLVWLVAIASFTALRYMDTPEGMPRQAMWFSVGIAITLQIAIGAAFGIYRDRYRIGSKDESLAVVSTAFLTAVLLQGISVAAPGTRIIALSVPIGAGTLAILATVGGRVVWRMLHESTMRPVEAQPVLIFGAGNAGTQLTVQMLNDPGSPYSPVGLLDDDQAKRNLRISGVRVLGNRTALAQVARDTGAVGLVVAVPSGEADLFRDLSHEARAADLHVKVLPGLGEILNGTVGIRDLRDINITDVLGRAQVDTDVHAIADYLNGKRVLVTGAGGSIGSELCRQIAKFAPAGLYMLDRDESALHSLQLSLTGQAMLDSEDVILCDIRDLDALESVFSKTRPEVVFHAAALKHLPMLEQYPEEAWKTNVLGTLNVLTAAQHVDVDAFVNISTDKAANPCSVLGYSKRIAERLTAGVATQTRGKFVSVRFGNVLGSRGSVLTAFAEQVSLGGPVTVTHPDVTRFFMMIPEACELVVQAAALGEDGDALVLEMGEPVRIVDVAEQVIAMSGKQDVEIVFKGLHNGEKLHEDLFGDDKIVQPTSHHLVRAVRVPPLAGEDVSMQADWDSALGFTRGNAQG